MLFCGGSQREQFLFRQPGAHDALHFELSFGERAGFVEHRRPDPGKAFQRIRPFEEHTSFRSNRKPAKNVSGMLKTSAHGHEITRKINARRIHSSHSPAPKSGGKTASSAAAAMTAGV